MRWDDDAAVFAAEMNEWRMDWIDTQTDRPTYRMALWQAIVIWH